MQLKGEIPRPLKFPRDIQMLGTGWVIQNINKYGNSVLPASLLDIMQEKTLCRLLTVVIDEEITIKKRNTDILQKGFKNE